jgi:hypothetical protein
MRSHAILEASKSTETFSFEQPPLLPFPFSFFFLAFFLLCGFGFASGDAGEARATAAIVHAVLRRSAAAVAPGGHFERVARVVLRQSVILEGG